MAQSGIWEAQEEYISARIQPGDIPRTLSRIRNVWDTFMKGYSLEYSFLDSDYDAFYHNEERTGRSFTVFAALAIGIGCLGLASFAAEQKTREIGIRRILGASVPGIMMLLSRDLIRWVGLAGRLFRYEQLATEFLKPHRSQLVFLCVGGPDRTFFRLVQHQLPALQGSQHRSGERAQARVTILGMACYILKGTG